MDEQERRRQAIAALRSGRKVSEICRELGRAASG